MKSRNFNKLSIVILLATMLLTANLISAKSIEKSMDEYLSYYTEAGSFSGVVLVAKDDQIIFSQGYGYADYELDEKNTEENIFRIGSLTKSFTAVSIMQLEERDMIDLNDPISKYIEDFPKGDVITIHHLLNHTSGIFSFTRLPEYRENIYKALPPKEVINLIKDKELDFEPGSQFGYSNSNYILLGYIIEQVSGQSYEAYLQKNIYQPLNMKNSGLAHYQKLIKGRTNGYQYDYKGRKLNIQADNAITAHAAGGLYSTVDDLYKWDQSFYDNKLLSQKSTNKIFNDYKDGFAYGWKIDELFGHKRVYHNGRSYGFTASISRYVDDNVTIIVLTNLINTPIDRIITGLAAIVFEQDYLIPPEKDQVDITDIENYTGTYKVNDRFQMKILNKDGVFYCQMGHQNPRQVVVLSENEFMVKLEGDRIRFIEDSNGNITRLILEMAQQTIPAKKVK